MIYTINHITKFGEKDVYQEGCDPNTTIHHTIDASFSSDSIEGVIEKFRDFVGAHEYDIERNACDEDGRIDISVFEDMDAYPATDNDIKDWKNGNIDLFNCIYTGYVTASKPVKI